MEDQQPKSAENDGQKSMQEGHGTPSENHEAAPAGVENISVPIQSNQKKPMAEPLAENIVEIEAAQPLHAEDRRPESVVNQQEQAPQDMPLPTTTPDKQEKSAEEGTASTTQNRQLKSAIESLLFIAGTPLSLDRLKGIFEEASKEEIETQLNTLRQEYESRGSGIMLVDVAGGYQLVTKPENAAWIRKFRSVKVSSRLSRPALETLAIVAYKQPITRTEVEAIRGVNIGGIVRNLMERRLVKIVGKKDVPGKPMLYGTTPEFLQYFGLKDLSSLPTLKEFQELEAGEETMEEISAEGAAITPADDVSVTEETHAEPVGASTTRENSA